MSAAHSHNSGAISAAHFSGGDSYDYGDYGYGPNGGYDHSGFGHHSGYGHGYGHHDDCCPLVVDLLCLIALLGAIGAAALFLERVIQIEIMMQGPGRRRRRNTEDLLWTGNCVRRFMTFRYKLEKAPD